MLEGLKKLKPGIALEASFAAVVLKDLGSGFLRELYPKKTQKKGIIISRLSMFYLGCKNWLYFFLKAAIISFLWSIRNHQY